MAWPILIILCLLSIVTILKLIRYFKKIEKFIGKNNLPHTVLRGIKMNRFLFYWGIFSVQPEWAKSDEQLRTLLTKFRLFTILFISSVFAAIFPLLIIIRDMS